MQYNIPHVLGEVQSRRDFFVLRQRHFSLACPNCPDCQSYRLRPPLIRQRNLTFARWVGVYPLVQSSLRPGRVPAAERGADQPKNRSAGVLSFSPACSLSSVIPQLPARPWFFRPGRRWRVTTRRNQPQQRILGPLGPEMPRPPRRTCPPGRAARLTRPSSGAGAGASTAARCGLTRNTPDGG